MGPFAVPATCTAPAAPQSPQYQGGGRARDAGTSGGRPMAMTIAFAAGAAILGIATAIGHSLISERKILGPLYADNPGGVLKSPRTPPVIPPPFHIPPLAAPPTFPPSPP